MSAQPNGRGNGLDPDLRSDLRAWDAAFREVRASIMAGELRFGGGLAPAAPPVSAPRGALFVHGEPGLVALTCPAKGRAPGRGT